ncbi:serine/threonine protein kinase [Salinarimonas sp.]|uniref:serine/threonine protein kinase n=1 Tax=Salinarimonas sp. TaxID=2766526 RepID=UPI00391B670B
MKADGSPLFAGWRWSRLPQFRTIAGSGAHGPDAAFSAPEVVRGGLSAATARSDLYSLCKALATAFDPTSVLGAQAVAALAHGTHEDETLRTEADVIAGKIEGLLRPQASTEPALSPAPSQVGAKRWDEGFAFDWDGDRYQVVSLLGQGGAGRTFKLEQLDPRTGDPIGTCVGKVAFDPDIGPHALEAYRKIRYLADHPCLSGVFATSKTWSADGLMALMRWRRGAPLDAWRGEHLPVLAELVGETDAETLLLRWAQDLCGALDVLHMQGWVHNDVSPGNVIVDDDGAVVLIDYDLAGPAGAVARTPGTLPFTSPERLAGRPATCSDDVYALASTLLYLASGHIRSTGCSPADDVDIDAAAWPRLAAFARLAMHPDPGQRFESGGAALRFLRSSDAPNPPVAALAEPPRLTPNEVPRVRHILQAYPGSRFGNVETRGLDTDFAEQTYVETSLDGALLSAIQAGEVSLVILCGNAGDGKTAFLQHLAAALGLPAFPSSDRTWSGRLGDAQVLVNLDGAASWKGRSADELLDDVFGPFLDGMPRERRIHLVAVNDGRLMEWIEKRDETPLSRALAEALGQGGAGLPSHVRLIELNLRSLVGGFSQDGALRSEFVDSLIDRLVGGQEAQRIWAACETCTARARCSMRRSARMMGASADPEERAAGALMRARVTAALQAVHQRNEVHITARELKAALSYIFFGLHDCRDLHENADIAPHEPARYAFDPTSERRQGELLRELARLDPGLEAHVRIDRYLGALGPPDPDHGAPRFPALSRVEARRKAYLAWTDEQIERVGGEPHALTLKDGRHLASFRDFPVLSEQAREKVRDGLCRGLSRLERLPEIAYRTAGSIPIRISPKTPTETAFWVDKPLEHFALVAETFEACYGVQTLHRHLELSYTARGGRTERLVVTLDLFALLMDLADGMQILDAFSDDVFANLNVFTQRLAQEDERRLRAWNPSQEHAVFTIAIDRDDGVQRIVLEDGASTRPPAAATAARA